MAVTTTQPAVIRFVGIRQSEEVLAQTTALRTLLEQQLNLPEYRADTKPVVLTQNLVQRLALMAGLSQPGPRSADASGSLRIPGTFHDTVFSRGDFQSLFSALLKLRYPPDTDWETPTVRDRILNHEMLRGMAYLQDPNHLES